MGNEGRAHAHDAEVAGRVEDTAWRRARVSVVRPAWRSERGLIGQVERRRGGLALALPQDDLKIISTSPHFRFEAVTAGAALDHVVAPGDLEVTGRHGRR